MADAKVLSAPNIEEQSSLIASAFFVEGAAEQLSRAQLQGPAFPDPMFHALYQYICRAYAVEVSPVLSEVQHRSSVISIIAQATGKPEQHASTFWTEFLRTPLSRANFRTLLSRFQAWQRYCDVRKNAGALGQALQALAAGDATLDDVVPDLRQMTTETVSLRVLTGQGVEPAHWLYLANRIGEIDSEYYSTGFPEWDRLISRGNRPGMPLGSINGVSAATGHGKSTLLRSILRSMCFGLNFRTCYLNYEVREAEFAEDLFAEIMGISPTRRYDWVRQFEAAGMSHTEAWQQWGAAKQSFGGYMAKMSEDNIFDVVHHMNFELSEVQALIDERYRRGYRVFMIDTINRVRSDEARGRRHDEVEYIVHSLEQQALRLNALILLACQENREKWKRADKRPRVDDLAGSSALEKSCHSVTQLFRADLYSEGTVDYAEGYVTKARGRGVSLDSRFRLLYSMDHHCYVPYPEQLSPEHVVVGGNLPPPGGQVVPETQ
jgi:hypothetical protein